MDSFQQIEKIKAFIEEICLDRLLENFRKGNPYLQLDFRKLAAFDVDLADFSLENPEEVLANAKVAVADFEIPKNMKRFNLRFKNLPKQQEILIRDIRSKDLEKFIFIEGVIRIKSDIRPQTIHAKFECPSCGNIIGILQLEKQFREPTRCGCGRKGKFILQYKELIDSQMMTLEEIPEKLEGDAQPKRINAILTEDLVSTYIDKTTNPGSKVRVVGIVKEIPIILRSGAKSTTSDILLNVNNIEPIEDSYSEIQIDKKEIAQIKKLSKDLDVYDKLVNSLAPDTRGYRLMKEALLLQLFGGVKKERKKGITLRGDMHVLMIGDPGCGKSTILERIYKIAPKARMVSGKGASGAGLTATTTRDEMTGKWTLEAGALVLANKGFVCVDEFDKMGKEDRSYMHQALEQQKISISKANVHATLRAETSVIAAANPKFERFDPYEMIAKQIDLPATLINRFDLIFPVRDIPDKDNDSELATFILEQHQDISHVTQGIDDDLLRKYIAYARQNIIPVMTNEAIDELRHFYVTIRNQPGSAKEKNKPIPITARQLQALVRFSEASAKTRLDNKVRAEDAKKAIQLLHYCLSQIGMDPKTGKIDIDRVVTGVSASQRSNIATIKDTIIELENEFGPEIPIQDIITASECKGIDENKIKEIIDKLKRTGDVFEVKRGYIKRH